MKNIFALVKRVLIRTGTSSFLFTIILTVLIVAVVQAAEVPAIQAFRMTSTSSGVTSNQTFGYEFTVLGDDITVLALGYYDHEGDGLGAAHPVGIWTKDGQLLTSVTVPSGTAAPYIDTGTIGISIPVGGYRYVNLNSPLILNANTTYVIGGLAKPEDTLVNQVFDLAGHPSISVKTGSSRLSYNLSGFAFPVLMGGGDAHSLNFLIETTLPPQIDIDIKPGSYPNSINLKSGGVVSLAVLTTDDFDATTIDPVTAEFADAVPLRWALEDVDLDGDIDLLFQFKTQELNLDNNSKEATLMCTTFGGTLYMGIDEVKIVQ